MNSNYLDTIGQLLTQMMFVGTLLLLVTGLAWLLVRNHSSAVKHRILSLGLLSLVAFPLFMPMLPQLNTNWWRESATVDHVLSSDALNGLVVSPPPAISKPIDSGATPSTVPTSANPAAPIAETAPGLAISRTGIWRFVTIVWLAGIGIGFFRWLRSIISASAIVRRATSVRCADLISLKEQLARQICAASPVELRCSPEIQLPLAAGVMRPKILLPVGYGIWDTGRLQIVLAHEMAHVARRDILWQIVAQFAAMLYWLHPLVWLTVRRMKVESEQASDDAVIELGEQPAVYATHLIELASVLRSQSMTQWCSAVAIANRSGVEARVRAIMERGRCRSAVGPRLGMALFVAAAVVAISAAMLRPTSAQSAAEKSEKSPGEAPNPAAQEMLSLPVRVVDAEGQPIKGVMVIPWALQSPQGHGQWRVDGYGNSEPSSYTTGGDGRVDVSYPRYAIADERVQTTEVTLSLDHPDFAYISHEGVDVPREEAIPHQATLQRGAPVEIVPLENGKPARLEGLYALWSDGRSWKSGFRPAITPDGALKIPPMPAGKGQVLLVRLDGKRATHFSPIVDLDLKEGETVRKEVGLQPAVRIEGSISDSVPRPVKNGRLKIQILPRNAGYGEQVDWFTWAPIEEDGTFAIDGWPVGEAAQIIALCDGYIAESGEPPQEVEGDRSSDFFQRPQVFSSQELAKPILLRMTPTVRCIVETVDQEGAPIVGVDVRSNPNVGWWNGGSQIYCAPLVRGEDVLIERDYMAAKDKSRPIPFHAVSDANGRAELELPTGVENLSVGHDDYELPIVRGRRRHNVTLVAGQPTHVRLVLQPKGTEHLGEWDKLAGVLFGCTGEECRRLLSDPGFRDKVTVVRKLLDEAKDPTAPAVLSKAHSDVAAAFDELEDQEEADKWRRKAAEQAAKLEATDGEADPTLSE